VRTRPFHGISWHKVLLRKNPLAFHKKRTGVVFLNISFLVKRQEGEDIIQPI